ncbi:MAG: hypothetical protein K9L66_13160 [Spirochaetaceae bacterium]|nr:hypothetical protein [Spirochaetaceae bacterium]
MSTYAHHEAGHTIVAQHFGLPVEYTTIKDENLLEATKTVQLSDYFEEEALMLGKLKAKGNNEPTREEYKIFYSILMMKLAGYVVIELTGKGPKPEIEHYDEDRGFALNTLNHLETERANEKYEKMRRIVEKILKSKWDEVESLANRLMEERIVYFETSEIE